MEESLSGLTPAITFYWGLMNFLIKYLKTNVTRAYWLIPFLSPKFSLKHNKKLPGLSVWFILQFWRFHKHSDFRPQNGVGVYMGVGVQHCWQPINNYNLKFLWKFKYFVVNSCAFWFITCSFRPLSSIKFRFTYLNRNIVLTNLQLIGQSQDLDSHPDVGRYPYL
jgi:hypothetical protein